VSGPVARDMVYYFHLHTELVLSAEQLLLAREQGINVSIDKEIIEKLTEFHGLEKTIGKAGMRALRPHLHFSHKELWEVHLLDDESHHHH